MTPEKLIKMRQELERHDQGHLLRFWDQIEAKEQQQLLDDLQSIDYDEVESNFRRTKANLDSIRNNKLKSGELEPVPDKSWGSAAATDDQTRQIFREKGLTAVGEGRAAVILLAGGQGTRLGSNLPKGMFDVGLPSKKTLYQLQAEKLLKLKQLAEEKTKAPASVPWYIMTSPATRAATSSFFSRHDHFGLPAEDVTIFEQGTLPCFDYEGRIILEEMHKVSRAPDGNGGLYRALDRGGILADLRRRGVEFVHVYCVDNILVKMADPVFIGFCLAKGAECGAKVVEKTSPHESVGVVCRVSSKFQVVEYSEILTSDAERRRPDGKLVFNAGNICNHFFTVDFLERVVKDLAPEMNFHIAQKKIPHVDPSSGLKVTPSKPNGIKLEKFVFDAFAFAQRFVCWQVEREAEFSPLKNADGAAKDTPTSCRSDLFLLHRQMIEAAGGRIFDANRNIALVTCRGSRNGETNEATNGVTNGVANGVAKGVANGVANGIANGVKNGIANGIANVDSRDDSCKACGNGEADTRKSGRLNEELICEISPLITYDGEGLNELVGGKKLTAPFHLELASLEKILQNVSIS